MSNQKPIKSEQADSSDWVADLEREVIEKAAGGVRLRPPLRVLEADDHPEPSRQQAA